MMIFDLKNRIDTMKNEIGSYSAENGIEFLAA